MVGSKTFKLRVRNTPNARYFPIDAFDKTSALEMALMIAAVGFFVIPVRGKKPLVDWGTEATTDEKIIRRWFAQFSDAGIAIVTGRKSRLVVIDVDQKNGKDGLASFRRLQEEYGLPEDTLIIETPSGGRHYYYAYPET